MKDWILKTFREIIHLHYKNKGTLHTIHSLLASSQTLPVFLNVGMLAEMPIANITSKILKQ